MRDPLHWVSVKYKLALLFAGLCLLAYGVGGSLVSFSAGNALEDEINARIEIECLASAIALDEELRLLTRRIEDFASDGFIRERFAALEAAETDVEAETLGEELRGHLLRNKLPLVPAFVELTLVSLRGEVVLGTADTALEHAAGVAREAVGFDGTWHSGLLAPTGAYDGPLQALSTPLRPIEGEGSIGRLVAWVDTGAWVASAWRRAGWDQAAGDPAVSLWVEDRRGRKLVVPGSVDGGGAARALRVEEPGAATGPAANSVGVFIKHDFPIARNGWRVYLRLKGTDAFSPVSGLQSRFLGVGVVLAVLTGLLLFFPMRFLVRPLSELREAARRIRGGDYRVRVEARSNDEVGELARSFNHMAEAVEDRTRRLRATAEELRARQRDVRAERDRLDTVIRSLRDGLVVVDADGQPLLSNAAGRPLLELLERRDPQISSHYVCGDEAAADGHCAACLVQPNAPPRSCVLDVDDRVYEIHVAPLPRDPDGRRGRLIVARDITSRLSEDERDIHQERLSVLGEVAAVMAHELNNPLTAVRMFAQMLADGLPPESRFREHTEVILRNTETCRRSIRELLGYATAATPETGPTDVHDVLEDVARFVRPLAERGGARVELELAAADAVVSGDEIQVRQLFVNLVMNALQAADGKPVTVTLASRCEGESLIVDVSDTGPGVAPDARQRIFDAFYTTKPRGEGTGLGLPTARRIAEIHGGGLELIQSDPGHTTFRVRLRRRGERTFAPAVGAASTTGGTGDPA